MSAIDDALARVRASESLMSSGVRFAAIEGTLEQRWRQAAAELAQCIRPIDGSTVLNEGGVYDGTWIESTGTINVEVLSRFAPEVTTATHLLFARHQREDGLIPYKVTPQGPAFSQIQIVTPLARTVWNHYLRIRDREYLRTMYEAMVRFDAWLVTYRDTRGTGGVEAFCTFDTGHDLSPRFWFVPERAFGDATRVDPANPFLPFVAPDLTANVACQRAYLATIADELGEDGDGWGRAAASSIDALFTQCFDSADGTFYDRDALGQLRRVQSDVLLRVLACEVGDDEFFAAALERYLMNTGKFLAHYGFTSLSMDDPRFDHDFTRNSWGGPVNFLSLIRAPHAFEQHGRLAELALTAEPVLAALAVADRFPQCLDPWSGAPGFTSVYSPALLWFLDAIERLSGILATPAGELWFSGLTPTRLDHGISARAVAYSRDGFELAADDERVLVLRDGAQVLSFPRGWRVIADTAGSALSVVNLAARPVAGVLTTPQGDTALELQPNERVTLADGSRVAPGFTPPRA